PYRLRLYARGCEPNERHARASDDPDGIRTRVAALKGLCPGPLDDGATPPAWRQTHDRRHFLDRQVRRPEPFQPPAASNGRDGRGHGGGPRARCRRVAGETEPPL